MPEQGPRGLEPRELMPAAAAARVSRVLRDGAGPWALSPLARTLGPGRERLRAPVRSAEPDLPCRTPTPMRDPRRGAAVVAGIAQCACVISWLGKEMELGSCGRIPGLPYLSPPTLQLLLGSVLRGQSACWSRSARVGLCLPIEPPTNLQFSWRALFLVYGGMLVGSLFFCSHFFPGARRFAFRGSEAEQGFLASISES